MNRKLKNILCLVVLNIMLLSPTAPTWAGKVSTENVLVGSNVTSRYASGNLVDARYSTDNRQFIQCIAVAFTTYTLCTASDSAGNYASCASPAPKFQEVVHAMTDSSSVYFVADLNGNCTDIVTYHGSDLLK